MEILSFFSLEPVILFTLSWLLMRPRTSTRSHNMLKAEPCSSQLGQHSGFLHKEANDAPWTRCREPWDRHRGDSRDRGAPRQRSAPFPNFLPTNTRWRSTLCQGSSMRVWAAADSGVGDTRIWLRKSDGALKTVRCDTVSVTQREGGKAPHSQLLVSHSPQILS